MVRVPAVARVVPAVPRAVLRGGCVGLAGLVALKAPGASGKYATDLSLAKLCMTSHGPLIAKQQAGAIIKRQSGMDEELNLCVLWPVA